jgi:8-oxo-dGTP pyrophosphatase MutT (NUDIX family)
MSILPLLDEIQTIARNGLAYSTNPYDLERYERLMALVSEYYGQALDLPPAEVRARLSRELGYITPKVGAEAGIFDEEGGILLVLRSDDETWCLPCGWVDPNEAPIETVVREVREETGLEAVPVCLVDVFSMRPGDTTSPHSQIAILYLCTVVGGEMGISHESLDVRYWRIEDVPAWHTEHRRFAEAARARWRRDRLMSKGIES